MKAWSKLYNKITMMDVAFVLFAVIPLGVYLGLLFVSTLFLWLTPLLAYWLVKVYFAYGNYLDTLQHE